VKIGQFWDQQMSHNCAVIERLMYKNHQLVELTIKNMQESRTVIALLHTRPHA
jgi:hypothetical protein